MSNRTDFADYIVQWAEKDPQRIDLGTEEMYAYEIKDGKNTHTSFTDDVRLKDQSFTLINQEPPLVVTHICVDGGLIEYGKEDYVGVGIRRGRNDCILITDDQLLFIELKTDSTTEQDKRIWQNFNEGAKQIKDFYIVFRDFLAEQGRPLSGFFPLLNSNVHAFVCIDPYPKLTKGPGKIPMTNRQNELEAFRVETGGLKVYPLTSYKVGSEVSWLS